MAHFLHAHAEPSLHREGVNITFTGEGTCCSDQWHMGGWVMQFNYIAPNEVFELERSLGRHFIKVIFGKLSTPQRGPVAEAKTVRSTEIRTPYIVAADQGALVAQFTETANVPANYSNMDALTITGPYEEAFAWKSFADRFGAFLPSLNDADAHMSGGFHLLDNDEAEICYVNLWTAGKGVNLSTHNHAKPPTTLAPAFAEVHWVFNNGSKKGGMYTADSRDGPITRRYPMQRGEEHGAFFAIDPTTGQPKLRDNGAVEYPWHGWEAGTDINPIQAYDVVAAFETNPKYL